MKLLRLVLTTCLLLGLSAAAGAEDKKAEKSNKDKIVGTWVLEKPETPKALPPGATIEFTKDGKLKLTGKVDGQDVNVEGTYSVDGDKLKTAVKDGDKEQTDTDTITKLTDKELVIKDTKTEETLIFKKKP